MTRLRIAIAAAAGVGLLMLPPRPASAQTANVNRCAVCHAGLADSRLSAPPRAVTNDVHDKAGVHCAIAMGACRTAPDANAAHDPAHGYKGKPTASAICVTCHAALDEKFKTSIHAQIFDKACVECHGNHGIRPPSDAWRHIERRDVHRVSQREGRSGIRRRQQDAHQPRQAESGHRREHPADRPGQERRHGVGDQELALADAGTKLILARTEMHAFNPDYWTPLSPMA